MRVLYLVTVASLLFLALAQEVPRGNSPQEKPASPVEGNLLSATAAPFVPNRGQWLYPAKFVHRRGAMTMFLEERGWVLDLAVNERAEPESGASADTTNGEYQKRTGVALRMTFEGDERVSDLVGVGQRAGHHNYFLGNDQNRWRTHVPLFDSVRYRNLYRDIDLLLRDANGVPEYDLLLRPGADLSSVTVLVDGGRDLYLDGDGSLVITTELGKLTQPTPKTWEVAADGSQHEVDCTFELRGPNRFGFAATGWDGLSELVIDPGLIWSTFLGSNVEHDMGESVAIDPSGNVCVTGWTRSVGFPATVGAYRSSFHGGIDDAFVSRLDPRLNGTAQLIDSTFLGGSGSDQGEKIRVDGSGVITVYGFTDSASFPTTGNAYDRTYNGATQGSRGDVFLAQLDPSRSGVQQLVYSTFLGGSLRDRAEALSIDDVGVVTLTGVTLSTDFPTSPGALMGSFRGGPDDAFVAQLDLRRTGSAQLIYSTYVGSGGRDAANSLFVEPGGILTVGGVTSSASFPTTGNAYDRTYNGGARDTFLIQLDTNQTGATQLVYSTYLGGSGSDNQPLSSALAVDSSGVITFAGRTDSANFPMTPGAYDSTFNGGRTDSFLIRLDPARAGNAQLLYSTFLGGASDDIVSMISVNDRGVVTVLGRTKSADFPTTRDAYDSTHNGGFDVFVSRLDPAAIGNAQLVHSTFLGSNEEDQDGGFVVDASGVATVTGHAHGTNFPTTGGAYSTIHPARYAAAFVSRLSLGATLYGDVHELPIATGGAQTLTVCAGASHAGDLYWIFGSVTGTTPGLNLLGVHIPLNPDAYSDVAISLTNTLTFDNFKGQLDSNGRAVAVFRVPANLPLLPGFTFHHAHVVHDASGRLRIASNPVPLRLR